MTTTTATLTDVIIIGAGQGGLQAAMSLRDHGYTGRLTIVGDEPGLPYQRPPLSKAYLINDDAMSEELLLLRPHSVFERLDIDLITGDGVTRIDRVRSTVSLSSGRELAFDHLILATGARPRELSVPGADLAGVEALRTCDDAKAIRAGLTGSARVVVIGGGFVGTEVAAAATKRGHSVTIVDMEARLLNRAVSPEISALVTAAHRRRGTAVVLNAGVSRLCGSDGTVEAVELTDGQRIPADFVVVGIGVVPNTEIADDAGLAVDNGILVDDRLRTNDHRISAIGDCARFPCAHADGQMLRLESVQNAVDHARHVAARLMGDAGPYDAVPWFWTDQCGLKIQIAGIGAQGAESVVIGDEAAERCSVLRFRSGELSCVESVNSSGEHMAARKILRGGPRPVAPVDGSPAAFDLKHIAREVATAR